MSKKDTIKIFSLNEIIKDNRIAPLPIIDNGVLLDKSLLLICGKPKAGKSFLSYNLGIALSEGISFAGFKINKPRKVLMLSGEGGEFPNIARIKTMCESRGIMGNENLNVLFDARFKLDDENDYQLLSTKLEEYKPEVLVLDPLVKFHKSNENSADEMGDVLGKLREIIKDHNLAIILIHHLGKSEYNGARGSSAIVGEYDSYIEISKRGKEYTLKFDMRHVETPDEKILMFDSESLWFFQGLTNSADETLAKICFILNEKNGLVKKDLVKILISKKILRRAGVYRRVNKEIEKGNLVEARGKLYPKNSNFDFLRVEAA